MTLQSGRRDLHRHAAGRGPGQKPEPVYLRAGQRMRLGIEGLGEQEQRVVG
jgi:2-keto-4-pentenoate hydratase/2-oxohepta-3-ene-1,7-dioic acid hydratase in catechol pathway